MSIVILSNAKDLGGDSSLRFAALIRMTGQTSENKLRTNAIHTGMRARGKASKTIKAPHCPECGAAAVIPIIHGIPTAAQQKALDAGNAVVSDREEWEGLSQWYCKNCGCDWSAHWRRFKKTGGVNATR